MIAPQSSFKLLSLKLQEKAGSNTGSWLVGWLATLVSRTTILVWSRDIPQYWKYSHTKSHKAQTQYGSAQKCSSFGQISVPVLGKY